MLFEEETSGKFLARWPTFFRPYIVEDAKELLKSFLVLLKVIVIVVS